MATLNGEVEAFAELDDLLPRAVDRVGLIVTDVDVKIVKVAGDECRGKGGQEARRIALVCNECEGV